MFEDSLNFFVFALKSASSLRNVVVRVQSSAEFVSKYLKVENEEARVSARRRRLGYLPSRKGENAIHYFSWHLRPFEQLLNVQLKVDVLGEKGQDLVIQHPKLAKYIEDLQDTEQRARGIKANFGSTNTKQDEKKKNLTCSAFGEGERSSKNKARAST